MHLDHYQIEQIHLLQEGGGLFGARHRKSKKPVTLLTLGLNRPVSLAARAALQERARTLTRIVDSRIARPLDHGLPAENLVVLVNERIEGRSLAALIEEIQAGRERLSPREALSLVREMADALRVAAHYGLLHTRLRPEFILLRERLPVLFGFELTPELVPQTPELSENPSDQAELFNVDYLSPEQAAGRGLDVRSNLYSLGVILYELLSGRRPQRFGSAWDVFERPQSPGLIKLETILPGLAEETYALVQKTLWEKAWARYDSFEEFLEAVDDALAAEQELESSRPGLRERFQQANLSLEFVLTLFSGLMLTIYYTLVH